MFVYILASTLFIWIWVSFLPALSKIDFNNYITITLFANMKCLSASLNFYLCLNCKFKIDSSSSLTLICLEAKVHAFNCSSISCSLSNKYSIESTHNIRFDPRVMKSIFDPLKSICRTIEMDSSSIFRLNLDKSFT